MRRQKVSSRCSKKPNVLTYFSFAWMEMTKTLATILRLFKVERTTSVPSKVREGFFVKITECNVRITSREEK